jgi:hypothetical protein
MFFHVKQCAPFDQEIKSAAKSEREREVDVSSQQTRKLSGISAVRVIETLRLTLTFWLQRNSITLLFFLETTFRLWFNFFYSASCS